MAVSEYNAQMRLFKEEHRGCISERLKKNKGAMPVFYRNQIKSKK